MSSLHTLEDAEERLDELREAGYVSDGDVDVDVRPVRKRARAGGGRTRADASVPQDYSTCLIVEGLPVVTEAKYDKLLQVLKRIYGQVRAAGVAQAATTRLSDGHRSQSSEPSCIRTCRWTQRRGRPSGACEVE